MPVKIILTRITALICMAGVMAVANLPILTAHEAHVADAVAAIADDSVLISFSEENICEDGKFGVSLKTPLTGAGIYYTTDGSVPECGMKGILYSAPFKVSGANIVKAVSCHGGKRSAVASRNFEISPDYCPSALKINEAHPDSNLSAVKLLYPAGGEEWTTGNAYVIRWAAGNNGENAGVLVIDLYYSNDSGKTWASITENARNNGEYEWKIPSALSTFDAYEYPVSSDKARIKVVASDYARSGAMLSARDISGNDFRILEDKSLSVSREAQPAVSTDKAAIADDLTAGNDAENKKDSEAEGGEKSGSISGKESENNLLGSGQEEGRGGKGSDSNGSGDKNSDAKKELQAKPEDASPAAVLQEDEDEDGKSGGDPQIASEQDDSNLSNADNEGAISPSASGDQIVSDNDGTVIEFNLNV